MPTDIIEVVAKPKAKLAKVADTRPRVAWALFCHPGSLSSGHARIPAIAATGTTLIFIDEVAGQAVLSVEDPSLPSPGLIPWENIASFGLVP